MKSLVTITLLALLPGNNTPYPKQFSLVPELKVKVTNGSQYVSALASARCAPARLNQMNPLTALWTVETGYQWDGFVIGVGHQSEHGIDKVWPNTESRDFLKVEYSF